jgi:hypothetical protein
LLRPSSLNKCHQHKNTHFIFLKKENVKECDNKSTKKSKINDNSNNIVNDNSNNIVNDNTTNTYGICRDYWKSTIPSYSEMNTRTRDVLTIQPFVNGKHVLDQNGSLEKHQESTYHKRAVQNLSFKQQERSVAQLLFNVSELERQENREV